MLSKLVTAAAVAATFATSSMACYVEVADSRGGGRAASGSGSGGTIEDTAPGASAGSGGATTASTETKPMLVVVDTGKTMAATPGEGVGVFVEYAQGGKWHVWWTCDTTQTGKACGFGVKAWVDGGAIDSSRTEGFQANDTFVRTGQQRVEASTTTTSKQHGLWLETAPGAVLTVQAAVRGAPETGFLFFVQDGKVNGGYEGQLTNPLMFQGSSP